MISNTPLVARVSYHFLFFIIWWRLTADWWKAITNVLTLHHSNVWSSSKLNPHILIWAELRLLLCYLLSILFSLCLVRFLRQLRHVFLLWTHFNCYDAANIGYKYDWDSIAGGNRIYRLWGWSGISPSSKMNDKPLSTYSILFYSRLKWTSSYAWQV